MSLKYDSKIIIGRSSKNHDKNMKPADNNLYIDAPVISREHAVLTLEDTAGVSLLLSLSTVVSDTSVDTHGVYRRHELPARYKAQQR